MGIFSIFNIKKLKFSGTKKQKLRTDEHLCPQHVASDDTRELLRGKAPCASNSFIKFWTICQGTGYI